MKQPLFLSQEKNSAIIINHQLVSPSKFLQSSMEGDSLIFQMKPMDNDESLHLWIEGGLRHQSHRYEWTDTQSSHVTLWINPNPKQPELTLDLVLNKDTNVNLNLILLGSHPSLMMTCHIVMDAHTSLAMKSSVLFNGEFTLNETVKMMGESSTINHQTLVIGSQSDRVTVVQRVDHQAKATQSMIQNALVANDISKLKFDVYGTIDKYQAKSKCYQHSKGIILGEQAWIEVDPKLIINEYDVEAGHGAAIGQMNPEELYYLTSRGLTETQAKQLIIHGLTTPFIDAFTSIKTQRYFNRLITRKLGGH